MFRTEKEEEELVNLTSSHALSQHYVSDTGIDEYGNTGIVEESNVSVVARGGSSSDETDGTQSKSIRKPKKRKKGYLLAGSIPRWRVVGLYLLLSTTALVLTVSSKRTQLWTINMDEYDGSTRIRGRIIYSELYKLLSVYILLLVSFWAVQGSDPGYISHDHMAAICREDGLSLMGLDEEEEAGIARIGNLEYCSANPDSPNEDQIPGSIISDRNHPSEIEITRRNNVNPPASTPTSTLMIQDDEGGNDSSSSSQVLNNLTSIATSPETKQSPLQYSDSVTNNHNKPYCTKQRRKPCLYCRFAPPLRSHHCRICNKCVASFDHHCTFIGTCIGERNHFRFWCFLSLQVLGFIVCSNLVGSSSLNIFRFLLDSDGKSMNANPSLNDEGKSQFLLEREDVMPLDLLVVMAAKLYLYPLAFLAFFMWGLHTFLAISNLTTFELSKGPKHIEYLKDTDTFDLPFSLGILGNIRLFCCQKDDSWRHVKRRLSLQQQQQELDWIPILWKPPGKIVRDSEDWWAHPWQNKYWSCC